VSALLASEVLKARTIRSPFFLLLAQLAITAIGVAGLVGSGSVEAGRGAVQLAQTVAFGFVFATILGILVVTNEFRHGTITPTFLVEPRRELVVAAKLLVGALGGLAFGVLSAVLMLAVALPWLSARGEELAVDGELVGAVARLVVAFVLASALGVGIGFLVRSQVGAIVATLGWFLVGESLLPLLGLLVDRDEGAETVNRYLPGSAFEGFVLGGEGDLLSTWAALLLVLVYVGVVSLAGLAITLRRDAV
jgi:ABC-2 type transport system permease protein